MMSIDGILDAWWKLASIFSGGMLGLFLLALVSRKVNRTAAVLGVVAGLMVITYISIPAFGSPVHTYLTVVFGTGAILVTGFVLTKLFAAGK